MNRNGLSAGDPARADWIRWAVSVTAAVVIMVVLAGFLRGPVVALPNLPVSNNRAAIDLVKASEQVMMHDTLPLFLPTEHDATVALPEREYGGNFLGYDASRLSFGDAGPNLSRTLPPAITVNGKPADQAKPVDALAPDLAQQPLVGFGRTEAATVTLPSRGGYIEVISATGQKVIAQTLPSEAAPKTEKEWQPMEFTVWIDAAGLTVPPRLTEGSRVEEVDAHFTNFLVAKFRIGARLRPGFYRVIIGP